MLSEQARASGRRRVMPSRMSLRRTKQRQAYNRSLGSSSQSCTSLNEQEQAPTNTSTSRQELNLRTPKRPSTSGSTVLKDIENKLFSPVKLIEHGLREKVRRGGGQADSLVLDAKVVEEVRQRFRKPKPLSEKKKIVDGILENLVNNMLKENPKVKEPVRAWCSPKKEFIEEPEIKKDDPVASTPMTTEVKHEPIEDGPSKMINPLPENLLIKSELITEEIEESDQAGNTNHSNACIDLTGKEFAGDEDKSIQNDRCITIDLSEDFNAELDTVTKTISPNVSNAVSSKMDEVTVLSDDESSNSTFQLPPEFVAGDSDNSLPIFDTPKKMRTVEMQKDSSMEISEDNNVVNIDLVKIENSDGDLAKDILNVPVKTEKCAFKFSPTDKESLKSNKMDIDLKSFKNQYLNEVHRDFKCNFSHKHDEKSRNALQLKTAIDFAIDASMKTDKRTPNVKKTKKKAKKRRMSGIVLHYENLDGDHNSKRKKKDNMDAEVSIQNDSMEVKISLKKKKFKLKIMQSKVEKTPKSLKQYVLKYSDGASKEIIGKPEKEVTPIKRKYIKQEKSPDNLIQTSIQNFFKGKSP